MKTIIIMGDNITAPTLFVNKYAFNNSCYTVIYVYATLSAEVFFSIIFTEGNNFRDFLFASLADITTPNWGSPVKKRICSKRSKFFPLSVTPFGEGKQICIDSYFPENVAIHPKENKMQILHFRTFHCMAELHRPWR